MPHPLIPHIGLSDAARYRRPHGRGDPNDGSAVALAGRSSRPNAQLSAEEANEELLRLTNGRGVDFILNTTDSPAALGSLAGALAIRGSLATVAAMSMGTEACFEVGGSLLKSWNFRTIVQGTRFRSRWSRA